MPSSCCYLQSPRWNGCSRLMNQSRVHAAQARKRTGANQIVPQLSAIACGAQSDSALLESCWQRHFYNLSTFKSLSGAKDQSASLSSTLCTSRYMTQQLHGQSGQFIWRTAGRDPLTWMRIGTPLWEVGLCSNLFVFRTVQNPSRV